MGATISNTTRRISFDNCQPESPPAVVLTSKTSGIEDKLGFNEITLDNQENTSELDIFPATKSRNSATSPADAYWISRYERLQNENQQIKQIIESEYEKSLESTNKLFAKPVYNTEKKIEEASRFDQLRSKVLKCYTNNPNAPLSCWHEVQEFNNRVNSFVLED